MIKVAIIAQGGSGGALFRYVISGWAQRIEGAAFPVGTLAVNVLGCWLVGILGHAFFSVYSIRDDYRAGILIGFLGSFTTFSTFGWEALKMSEEGQFRHALVYVLASNVVCLLAVWIGYRLAIKMLGVSS